MQTNMCHHTHVCFMLLTSDASGDKIHHKHICHVCLYILFIVRCNITHPVTHLCSLVPKGRKQKSLSYNGLSKSEKQRKLLFLPVNFTNVLKFPLGLTFSGSYNKASEESPPMLFIDHVLRDFTTQGLFIVVLLQRY